jgi:hypothetical protein
MVRYSKLSGFCWVLHHNMATFLPYFKPTILFKYPEELIIFHYNKGNIFITHQNQIIMNFLMSILLLLAEKLIRHWYI